MAVSRATVTEKSPSEQAGIAPDYGVGARLPVRGVVSDMLKRYLDEIYKV